MIVNAGALNSRGWTRHTLFMLQHAAAGRAASSPGRAPVHQPARSSAPDRHHVRHALAGRVRWRLQRRWRRWSRPPSSRSTTSGVHRQRRLRSALQQPLLRVACVDVHDDAAACGRPVSKPISALISIKETAFLEALEHRALAANGVQPREHREQRPSRSRARSWYFSESRSPPDPGATGVFSQCSKPE